MSCPAHVRTILRRESLVPDVYSGVNIPVVMGTALRADPFPDGQVLRARPLMAADMADLGTWAEPAYGPNLPPIPLGLIFQHPAEFRPGYIGDASGQPVVSHHILDGQVLDSYPAILPNDIRGQLLQEIPSGIGYLLMYLRHGQLLLAIVITSPLLSGERPLGTLQLMQQPSVMPGIGYPDAVAEDHKILQPDVDAYRLSRRRQLRDIHAGPADGYEVFSRRGLRHRSVQYPASDLLRYPALDPAQLRQPDGLVR